MIRAGQIALGLLGALALVFLCLLGFAAHWKSGRAALLARGSHIAQTTVGPIEYRVFGEGPAVLVLHGMMGGYDQGLLIAKAVGKPNFQFIAVSRPGYLRTPLRSGRTFEEQADGYVALLDALKIEKAGVIAYSAGGHSAVPLVLRHPERCWGLVLLSGHTRPMGEVPSKASTKQAILTYVVKSDLFSLTMHSALQKNTALLRRQLLNDDEIMASRDPTRRMAMLAFFEAALPIGMRWEGLSNDVKQMASSSLYEIDQIRIPTLVIHGTADPVLPFAAAESTARGIPHAQLFQVTGGGHLAAIVHGNELRPKVEAFLEACAPPIAGK